MSVMCKVGKKCCATKGMCAHEKMMLGVAMLSAFVAVAHWGLQWF